MISIKNIKKWKSDEELREFCEHIVSHSERYTAERIFEAKEIFNNLASQEGENKKIEVAPLKIEGDPYAILSLPSKSFFFIFFLFLTSFFF